MSDRNDALGLVLDDELNQLVGRLTDLYEPLAFRNFVNVQSSLPSGVDYYEFEKMMTVGQIQQLSPNQTEFVLPSESTAQTLYRLFRWGNAVAVTDDELEKVARLGSVGFPTNRFAVQVRMHEETFDALAAYGNSALGVEGLYTLSDTTDPDAQGIGTTTKTWVGVTTDTLRDTVIEDLEILIDSIPEATMDSETTKILILPSVVYRKLNRSRYETIERTSVLSEIQSNNPGVQIVQWNRGSSVPGLGAGTHRILAMSRRPDMYITQFANLGRRVENHAGYEVAMRSKAGGVYSVMPQTIAKLDVTMS